MAHRILLGLLSMLIAMASVAHANSKASKTVLVYQTTGQPPAYSPSFNVYVAGLGYTAGRGLAYGLSNAKEPNPAGFITPLPTITAVDGGGNPLAQDTLLSSANQMVAQNITALAAQLSAYMKTAGAASGIYNYQQQVMVQGNAHPMYLYWQAIVDANARPRYGNVQLIPSVPNFVYGDYVPLAVDATLPASFSSYTSDALSSATGVASGSLPPPGQLQWYQVNQQMQEQTAAYNFNLNGAYDAPTVNPNPTATTPGCALNGTQVVCDPDYGLKCLINHASDPNCPTVPINGYTDFITLENQQGASAGWLDYVRSLTPVYTTDPTNPAQQIAVVTVDVSSRVWQQGRQLTCTSPNFYPASWPYGAGWNCVDNLRGSHYLFENTVVPSGWGNTGVNAGTGTALMEGTLTTLSHNDPGGNCPLPAVPGNYILLYQLVNYRSHGNKCSETEYYFISDGNQYTYSSPGWTSYSYFGNYGSPYIPLESGSPTFTATSTGGGSGSGVAGGTYTNAGTIGYQVTSVVDRYYVTPDGNYVLTGEVTTQPSVPQYPYNKSVTLPAGATMPGYANIIIDPFGTNPPYQTYDYTNDTVNGLPATSYCNALLCSSVAPICRKGSSACP